MFKKSVAKNVIVHSFNGNAGEETKFIEVDGVKYQADAEGKVVIGADNKPVPYVEPKGDGGKGDELDIETADLDTLAKKNPALAKLLDDMKKRDADEAQRIADLKKKEEEEASKKGEWQKLADTYKVERDEALKKLGEKDEQLGKYAGSVTKVLKDIKATIPKDNLALIPEDFSPRQQLEYIISNAKLLGAKMSAIKGDDGVDKNAGGAAGTDEDKLVSEIEDLIKKGREGTRTKAEDTLLWEKSKKLQELRQERLKKEGK